MNLGAGRGLLILAGQVLVASLISWWWAFEGVGAISSERVGPVAQGILQVVAFLVGGYSAGAFLLYTDWAKGLRGLRDNISSAIGSDGLGEFEKKRTLWTISLFELTFAPLIWFAVAGFSAIGALANGQDFYDRLALGSLGIGFGLMPLCFYQISIFGEKLRESAGAWKNRLSPPAVTVS